MEKIKALHLYGNNQGDLIVAESISEAIKLYNDNNDGFASGWFRYPDEEEVKIETEDGYCVRKALDMAQYLGQGTIVLGDNDL